MKISWQDSGYGQTGFHAEVEEYDAVPPVSALLLDHHPVKVNAEREAVAAYLAFGPWVSGDFKLPRHLGPTTAAAIERDAPQVAIRPGPIEYYPKPLDIGLHQVMVNFADTAFDPDEASITVLPASEWTGALRSLQSLMVASNAFALDAGAGTSFESIRARLAVATLFAGELAADTLVIVGHDLPAAEREKLAALLQAARLGIEFLKPTRRPERAARARPGRN